MTQKKAFLGWQGGKSRLVKTLLPLVPVDHRAYVEVFAGAAWLLFSKEPSKVEVVNDVHSELVTLYRVVQNHLPELLRLLQNALTARAEFERLKAMDPAHLTDVQRAGRFYYLMRTCFGSKLMGQSFGVSTTQPPRLNPTTMLASLESARLRLQRVVVERLDFQECIQRYDKSGTFFYVDPHYWGCERDYGDQFSRDDFGRLRDTLATCRGRWLMSINDTPGIRSIFEGFNVAAAETLYSVNGKQHKPVTELLISNYDLPVSDR
jgi:DNA adenine methylase